MDFKEWWKSKTLWGAIVIVVSLVLQLFGKIITPDQQTFLTDQLTIAATAIGEIVGVILVIIGRLTAKSRIGSAS